MYRWDAEFSDGKFSLIGCTGSRALMLTALERSQFERGIARETRAPQENVLSFIVFFANTFRRMRGLECSEIPKAWFSWLRRIQNRIIALDEGVDPAGLGGYPCDPCLLLGCELASLGGVFLDCGDELTQAVGAVQVGSRRGTLCKVDITQRDQIVAICSRGSATQAIPILDLPMPEPRPEGVEWIGCGSLNVRYRAQP